jgi:hypothetical protein
MARVEDEDEEDEEELDPNQALSAPFTKHESASRKAEHPINNTPSMSVAWTTVRSLTPRGVLHFQPPGPNAVPYTHQPQLHGPYAPALP